MSCTCCRHRSGPPQACGLPLVRVQWWTISDGRRQLRRECTGCGGQCSVKPFHPQTAEALAAADQLPDWTPASVVDPQLRLL
jgi:hypothetical protein